MFKIGIIADLFRMPLRQSVDIAAEAGAAGVSFYAPTPELDPEAMSYSQRLDFRRYCGGKGLEIASLVGELGGHGLQRADENEVKIPRMRKILELASDLGTRVVSTHIGVIPAARMSARYGIMRSACAELGKHAREHGVVIAIETGPEPSTVLKAFLDDLDEPGIGVNLDPANLKMVLDEDPVDSARILAPYIVSTHAKDGRHLQDCDPEAVYDAFAEGGFEGLLERTGALFEEKPLGQGDVRWIPYLEALKKSKFSGYLTIEREVVSDPFDEARHAVRFLKEILERMEGD